MRFADHPFGAVVARLPRPIGASGDGGEGVGYPCGVSERAGNVAAMAATGTGVKQHGALDRGIAAAWQSLHLRQRSQPEWAETRSSRGSVARPFRRAIERGPSPAQAGRREPPQILPTKVAHARRPARCCRVAAICASFQPWNRTAPFLVLILQRELTPRHHSTRHGARKIIENIEQIHRIRHCLLS